MHNLWGTVSYTLKKLWANSNFKELKVQISDIYIIITSLFEIEKKKLLKDDGGRKELGKMIVGKF